MVETQNGLQEGHTSKVEESPSAINYDREKEVFSPVELDGPSIPRQRHFSETSTVIAPQVVSTNISCQTDHRAYVETSDGRAELSTEKDEPQRDTGLVTRGIGTKWRNMPKTRRTLILLIAAAITVAVVLLAILLGVFLSRRHNDKAPSAADAFAILPTSKLAALNFQNTDNLPDKSVFFQLSSSHALMRARCNTTTNQQWVFENVSQSMIDGGSATFPKTGTPLVAVAPDAVDAADVPNFWIDLYFLSASNIPFQIWSWSTPQTDPSKDLLWHQEGLQNYQAIFRTGFAAGTQLAAYRDQCAQGCSNSSRLLYQGANGDLMMGESTVANWMEWKVTDLSGDEVGMPQLPQLETNSSVAATRFSPTTEEDPVGMRMYYDVSHQLEEHLLVNGTWLNGSLEASLGEQATPPDISVVAFTADPSDGVTDTSLDRTLLTVLFDNGTIAVHWQESVGAEWTMGFAAPTNVTALALNYGLQAYCLTKGVIQEWQIDRLVPTNWTLISNVTSALD